MNVITWHDTEVTKELSANEIIERFQSRENIMTTPKVSPASVHQRRVGVQ